VKNDKAIKYILNLFGINEKSNGDCSKHPKLQNQNLMQVLFWLNQMDVQNTVFSDQPQNGSGDFVSQNLVLSVATQVFGRGNWQFPKR
jgi:succinylarginine dihydrolase